MTTRVSTDELHFHYGPAAAAGAFIKPAFTKHVSIATPFNTCRIVLRVRDGVNGIPTQLVPRPPGTYVRRSAPSIESIELHEAHATENRTMRSSANVRLGPASIPPA